MVNEYILGTLLVLPSQRSSLIDIIILILQTRDCD